MTSAPAAATAARAAAADRPRRRRDDPRGPPGHPVLDGRAHRRGPDRTSARVRAKKPDGSWGPWYEAEALEGVGPDVRGPARHRTGVRRPHHHGADRRHPAGRGRHHRGGDQGTRQAGAGVRARQRRAAVRAEHQRRADQPAAGAGRQLAAAIRRHGARAAAQHHRPRTVGRRRGDAVRKHGVRQRNPRRHRPPHRGQQRLRPAGFGRHRPVDLRVPHPHAGLVRHRLQRTGRQVRPGLRGPRGRHGQAGRGRRTPAASTATPGAWR